MQRISSKVSVRLQYLYWTGRRKTGCSIVTTIAGNLRLCHAKNLLDTWAQLKIAETTKANNHGRDRAS
jgi:hypothetical protein